VINVLAAPIAGGLRSVEQFQRGIGELFRAVENLNTTLENLNETAMRVNRLVAEIEEPVRVMMPQVTRTIETADEMSRLLEGPVRSAAPQLERIADTLSSPAFGQLPEQLSDFATTITDVSARLGPLTQFAENAGGLLGAFKLPGMAGAPKPGPSASTPSARAGGDAPVSATTTKAPARKAPTRKAPAKRSPTKKASTEKASTKKKKTTSPAKKSPRDD